VTGRLAPGLAADLVVLEGDPFDFTGMTDRVRQVWSAGRKVAGAR
jgi:imidazolonepropionase-like amidohydrolase